MHEVQTLRRFGLPSTIVRTRWMFGFQRRLVRRCEWEMLLPKLGLLPQTSHVAATVCSFRCRQAAVVAVDPQLGSTVVGRMLVRR
jgi:hypothetical protein